MQKKKKTCFCNFLGGQRTCVAFKGPERHNLQQSRLWDKGILNQCLETHSQTEAFYLNLSDFLI